MGLREIGLANKQRVVITALDYFIERGLKNLELEISLRIAA